MTRRSEGSFELEFGLRRVSIVRGSRNEDS